MSWATFFVWCGSCYFLVGDTLNGMVAGGYAKGISEGCVVMLIHSILSILAPKAPHQTHTFHPIHDETEEEGNRQEYTVVSVYYNNHLLIRQ